ncbi:ribosomal protein S18-alanine N-acetyltransferase [Chloroflexota bacterium]
MNLNPPIHSGDLSGLLIRKMLEADLEQVVAIDQVSFSLPWPARSFSFELTDNFVSRCWVADVDGRIAAMMVGWLFVDELHIATLATHPDYRRRGVGKKILIHGLCAARDENVIRAFLEVRESNEAALHLYRGLGFIEDGRRQGYYKDTDEDALLMSLNDLGYLRGE